MLYNNVAGVLNPTVAGPPTITIPVVAITAAAGATINGRIASGTTTFRWTTGSVSTVNTTGNLISSFSSYGLAPDLSLKPDIGAPGGFIRSTWPLALGGYANLSGTSMSSPHVAGAAALYLEAHPHTSAEAVRGILQNSASPKPWWAAPTAPFLDNVHRQGAGMLRIDQAVQATASVTPAKLSLGESQAGPSTQTLSINNNGLAPVTYTLSHAAALATGPNTFTVGFYNAPSDVTFSSPTVNVPGGGSASFTATISPNSGLPDHSLYGGYIVLTPDDEGQTLRVPFAGFKGDYQSIQVMTPTANGFPWLARLSNGSLFKQLAGASFNLTAGDFPYFIVHLDHQSQIFRMEVFDANSGRAWHRADNEKYMARNSSATSFFATPWDGITVIGNGNGAKGVSVPNGTYVMQLSVLKALGDENNPADWETWTSPAFSITR